MQKLYKRELILITFDKISSFRKLFWHVTGYQESKWPGLFGIYLGIGLCDIDKNGMQLKAIFGAFQQGRYRAIC